MSARTCSICGAPATVRDLCAACASRTVKVRTLSPEEHREAGIRNWLEEKKHGRILSPMERADNAENAAERYAEECGAIRAAGRHATGRDSRGHATDSADSRRGRW